MKGGLQNVRNVILLSIFEGITFLFCVTRQCDHDNDSPYSLTPLLPLALPVPRVSRGLQSSETTERVDTVTQTAARIIRLLDILIIATECLKSEIVHK